MTGGKVIRGNGNTGQTPEISTVVTAPAAPAGPHKTAVIAFQQAVLQSDEGKRILADLQKKYSNNRDSEGAKKELQEAYNALAAKFYEVMTNYAQQQGYTLVLDISQQPSNVLYASETTNITKQIIDAYNLKSGVPAPPAQAAAAAPTPAGSAPAAHYSCTNSVHASDAIGSEITGEGTGAEITLYDENTRSEVGKFTFLGGLWFFNGGESTEVQAGTRVLDFSLGNYHQSGTASLSLCASGKYFILTSDGRHFRIGFPSAAFAAFIMEIE